MKKNIKLIMFLFTIVLIIAGCKNKEQVNENVEETKIVISATGEADMAIIYNSITELTEDTDVIVYGEVVETNYFVRENGMVWTSETIQVDAVLGGNIQIGENIVVNKMGGIVTLSDYINSFPESFRSVQIDFMGLNDYTDLELEQNYISKSVFKDVPVKVGMRSIYFLVPSQNDSDCFESVGAYQGQYAELPNGTFLIPGSTLSYDEAVEYININLADLDILETEDSESISPENNQPTSEKISITYDEIMRQIKPL